MSAVAQAGQLWTRGDEDGDEDDDDDDAGCAVFDLLVPYRRLSSVSDGRASRESAGNVSTRDASVYI